jgi:CheY-like chemotaxis protein
MLALVVDDEREHRQLVCDILEQAGWRVELAEDGLAALGRVPQARPDVILLDLRMPNLDGAGLLKMLRSTSLGTALRVVVVTGAAKVPADVRALADAVLQKPFTDGELIDAIAAARAQAAR